MAIIRKIIKTLLFLLMLALAAGSYWYGPQLYRFYLKTYYQDYKKETLNTALNNARALYKQGRYGDVLEYLETMERLYPGNAEMQRLQGLSYIKTGEKARGAQLVIASLKRNEDVRTIGSVVEILFEEEEYTDLITLLSRYDVMQDSYLSYVYGVSLYKLGKYAKALPYLQAARRLGKGDYDIFYYTGMAYEETGNTAEAVRDYEEAYRMDQVRREAREGLIRCYRKLRQFEKAGKLIRGR